MLPVVVATSGLAARPGSKHVVPRRWPDVYPLDSRHRAAPQPDRGGNSPREETAPNPIAQASWSHDHHSSRLSGLPSRALKDVMRRYYTRHRVPSIGTLPFAESNPRFGTGAPSFDRSFSRRYRAPNSVGYRAGIRTPTIGFKGPCATVTPLGSGRPFAAGLRPFVWCRRWESNPHGFSPSGV